MKNKIQNREDLESATMIFLSNGSACIGSCGGHLSEDLVESTLKHDPKALVFRPKYDWEIPAYDWKFPE